MKKSFMSKLGMITISENDDRVDGVCFGDFGDGNVSPLLDEAQKQISEYLDGKRTEFELPLLLDGTDFQKRIWEFLLTIPYGKTATYAQAALYAGSPKGARAAGAAIGNNPIAIVVPCHRVVGSNGQITGYRYGVGIKKALLELEQ